MPPNASMADPTSFTPIFYVIFHQTMLFVPHVNEYVVTIREINKRAFKTDLPRPIVDTHCPLSQIPILRDCASDPKVPSFVKLSEQLIKEGIVVEVDEGILCLRCGKKKDMFIQMKRHLTSHGIDNQHPCPFCERVPTSEEGRRKHIQRVHKKTLSFKQIRALPPFQDRL